MSAPTTRRYVGRLVIGLVAALLIAESAARLAEAEGPPALRWYDAATQLKVEDMTDLEVDVVFAGTSMAWQAFDPTTFTAETGLTAYNAGLAGGVPTVMERWLTEEVVPRLRPATVVWGLSTLDFSPSFGTENIERYDDALETRRGVLAAVERVAAGSALVRYRSILRDPDKLLGDGKTDILDDVEAARSVLGPGGVRRDYDVDISERRASVIASRLAEFRLDPSDLASVIRTVERLRADDVEVVLAELPLPTRTTELHPGGLTDLARVHAAIQLLAAELDIRVVDLRAGFTDEEFVDYTHLGPTGVTRVTKSLAGAVVDDATEPTAKDAPSPAEIGALALRLGSANDAAYGLLTDRTPGSSSEFWYFAQHYGRSRDLGAAARSGQSPEVVMVGSSLMVSAGMPSLFTELDGRRSYNAAFASTEPQMLQEWTADVVALASPELVVYGISVPLFRDRALDDPGCGRIAQWELAAGLRPLVFSGLPAASRPDDPAHLLLSRDGVPDPVVQSPLESTYDSAFATDGERLVLRQRTDEEIDRSLRQFAPQAETLTICDEFVEAFVDTIAGLREAGVEVLVVSMPISDRLLPAFPGGRAQLDEQSAPLLEAALDAGASSVLDLSNLLTVAQFRDLNHANREGAEIVTRAIVEHLASIGL